MGDKVNNDNRGWDMPDTQEQSIATAAVELTQAELKQVAGGLYRQGPPPPPSRGDPMPFPNFPI
jgi:hypothetical protein